MDTPRYDWQDEEEFIYDGLDEVDGPEFEGMTIHESAPEAGFYIDSDDEDYPLSKILEV